MAYVNAERRSDLNVKQDDLLASKRFVLERKPDSSFFYELEEAVVLDVVMDENHPLVKNNAVLVGAMPPNIDGSEVQEGTEDYGRIGCIKFRFLNSERNKKKEQLNWAYPIECTGITEWPLMNETVIVGVYLGKFYYSRKLNFNSIINSNASFITERVVGKVDENINEYTEKPYEGPRSQLNYYGGPNYTGVLGQYFKFNPKIRGLKRYEGDTILESRFGSSVRFGAYDDNRTNDSGLNDYSDGGGNPMILIRNRQAPIKNPEGQTARGYTREDINKDGSSIHITSGKTISKFAPETKNAIISGNKPVQLPKFDGDQIVINSDRLVFSSKSNEMFFFSKKKIGMTSDDTISISCPNTLTLTSLKVATINSPQIFLGDHAKIYEPALLGRSTVAWMYAMCDWMLLNVNTQIQILTTLISFATPGTGHSHIGNMGKPTPIFPPSVVAPLALWAEQLQSLQASQISLLALRSQLSELMSSRVFVSGGSD
jgi:hypothetical protein